MINNFNLVEKLTSQHLIDYSNDGWLLIENVFQPKELDVLIRAVDQSISNHKNGSKNLEGLVLEETSSAVRTINGPHLKYEIFSELCCHPRILPIAQKILDEEDVYVHQFKVNLKEAFAGDVWEWHQDYIYWLKGDGIPEPKAISIAILLDDITEFNGPLMFIPGSHKQGVIDISPREDSLIDKQPSWLSNVKAKIKYPAPKDVVSKLVQENGLIAPKASKGSLLIFDSNILHASNSNLSPFQRRYILITYNPVTNVNPNFPNPRPDFLAGKDFSPLSIKADNILDRYERLF